MVDVAGRSDSWIAVMKCPRCSKDMLLRRKKDQTSCGSVISSLVLCCYILAYDSCSNVLCLLCYCCCCSRYFVSCSGYPVCRNAIWLPNFVKEATVLDSKCPKVAANYSYVHTHAISPLPTFVLVNSREISVL